jgi:leucyl aminopeptidase (aminopeptidase T)
LEICCQIFTGSQNNQFKENNHIKIGLKKNSAYLPNISKYTSNYQFNHRKVSKRTTSWTQNVRELSAPFIQG